MTITIYQDSSSDDAPDYAPITAKYAAAVGVRRYLLTQGLVSPLSNDALVDKVVDLLKEDADVT